MRYLLAGESHGPALLGIVEGFPAGLAIPPEALDAEMARRLEGHGRGVRARGIETDRVRLLAGLRDGVTLGSPIALLIENRDFTLRRGQPPQRWTVPRPGHADLAGLVKYGYDECGPVAERASARTTACLVAVGALAKALLAEFGIEVLSHVVAIGSLCAPAVADACPPAAALRRIRTGSPVRCLDPDASAAMIEAIDAARTAGTTLGGVFEVIAFGVPAGLGSYVHPDRRLDAQLAADLMAVPSVKAVEIGAALEVSGRTGHEAHDEVLPVPRGKARGVLGTVRLTNRAGGLEGGVTNGEPLRVRGYAKPISTVQRGLRSVDLATGEPARSPWVRSDTCVVPASGVIGEAVVAWRLACALADVLGGDTLEMMLERHRDLIRRQTAPAARRSAGRGPQRTARAAKAPKAAKTVTKGRKRS
jgi:chorismate synthase